MKGIAWESSLIITYLFMVTQHKQTYHADHFEMYKNIKSLCCITKNNTVLQVTYTSKQMNLQKKRSGPWLSEVGAGGKWDEDSQKVETSISKQQRCNAQYDKHS